MTSDRDLRGIRRVIQQEVPKTLKPGLVVAKLPHSVKVRLTGSNLTVEAAVLRGAEVQVGDDVVLFRLVGQHRWTVLGAAQGGSSAASPAAVANFDGVLAPPSGFRVYNGWGLIVAMWDTPAQRTDLSFQVQVADDTAAEDNAEYHVVSGHNFISVQNPGTKKRLRVRCVDEGNTKSGWSEWLTATAQTVFFNTGTEAAKPFGSLAHEGEPFYAYDTKILYICHNEVWEPIQGGGNPVDPGSGPGYWDVTAAPEQPGSYDNEFSASWADFTEFDPQNRMTPSIVGGTLTLSQTTGYSAVYPGLWKQFPDTPWTVVVRARVAPLDPDLADCFWFNFGLAVRETAAADDTQLTRVLRLEQTSLVDGLPNRVLRLWHLQGLHASGWGTDFLNTNASIQTDSWVYFRLRYEGLVGSSYPLWFEVSLDGFVWEAQKVTFAHPPLHVGLITWNFDVQSKPTVVEGLVDFFRYTPACVDPNQPVSGRWISTHLASQANLVGDVVPFDYNTPSPLSLGDIQAGEHVHTCKVLVDTPFNGTCAVSIGEPGAVERLMPAGLVDLQEAGQYVNTPEYTYPGPTSLHLYFSKSGCTQGAGRVILIRKESYHG